MVAVSRSRPMIGDIIEIAAGGRFAYAQFTHRHSQYGALLRVLPGLHVERLFDFHPLISQESQFDAFFPLGAACNRRLATVVANEAIPSHFKDFPVFRACVRTKGGRGPYWLWDGEREWLIGELQPGMEHLPVRGVLNDALLIERILQGWRNEFDV